MYSIASFIQASSIITPFATAVAEHDTWITALIAALIMIPLLWIFLSLSDLYPQKSLIEINDFVFGPIFGKIFSIFYILHFFMIAFSNERLLGDFVVGNSLPETPLPFVLAVFILVCCFAARTGIESMARYSSLVFYLTLLFTLMNVGLLLRQMDLKNFLPILTFPVRKYIQATHIFVTIPFGEIIAFTMVVPNLRQGGSLKKSVYSGFALGFFCMIIILLRNTAVLGGSISFFSSSSFDAIRMVNLEDTLTRLEVFYVIMLIIMQFFKISLMIYVISSAIKQTFHLPSYRRLVPLVGVLICSFALSSYASSVEFMSFAESVAPFVVMGTEIFLPVFTLMFALLKNIKKRSRESNAA